MMDYVRIGHVYSNLRIPAERICEQQLLCIARLVLLEKDFILMDEPTSSLARKTDERIQQLMRTVLADKTVTAIAHRLESLEQYDLILEMVEGKLLRHGRGHRLM